MKEIIQNIKKLKELSGNAQIDYLKQISDNELFREILWYTYNPDLKFGVAEKAFKKSYDMVMENIFKNSKSLSLEAWRVMKKHLDKFVSQKGVRESEICDMIADLWANYDNEELELFKGILLKDLRISMGLSSFNKVWKDFYTKPQVMLAKPVKNIPDTAYVSRKMDGSRCYYLNGKFYSRTNKELSYEPTKHILEQLKDFNSDKYVLDGEILYLDKELNEDFQKGISLVSKKERLEGCDNLHYACFDMVDKHEFLNKKCSRKFANTYMDMCKELQIDLNSKLTEKSLIAPTKRNNIKVVLQSKLVDLDRMQELVNKNGWEGLMVRDSEKPYECKRTSILQKIKKMQDNEFELVGFNVGTGKFKNTLGAITIKLDTGETVDVGSGFTDIDREYIWNNRQELLNSEKLVKVQYFEKSKDKHGNNSLRFPVFKCFRTKEGEENI